jgi:hypothetical protein
MKFSLAALTKEDQINWGSEASWYAYISL